MHARLIFLSPLLPFFYSLVNEWIEDFDFNKKLWTCELEWVYLYWIAFQDQRSQNIGRNVSLYVTLVCYAVAPSTTRLSFRFHGPCFCFLHLFQDAIMDS